ncbi:MAG: transposase [Gammaproteobacteria bacterium]|jgi:transposase
MTAHHLYRSYSQGIFDLLNITHQRGGQWNQGCSDGYRAGLSKVIKNCLPNADVVFDRFHVMKNHAKAIQNQRRIEFREADRKINDLIKGSLYLLLPNADKLSDKLEQLLNNNQNLNLVYVLKEQLQAL